MPVSHEEMIEAILRPIDEAFDAQGITPAYLAKKLKKELHAKKIKVQIPKGEKKFIYSMPLPDWDIRQKARQDAHMLMGHYPAKNQKAEKEDGKPLSITVVNYGNKPPA